ncbi:MAG: peptidylprolyl isomerase [Saprospiraceae bacterium]|nr:MAG: peptidylprolyl isomerase [Saprospiraceae bacterium]
MIGLGLGGFLIMDMMSAGNPGGGSSSQFVLGKIAGEKIDRGNFERVYSLVYGNSSGDVYSRRNFLWNYFVEEKLVTQESEAIGLGVSNTELIDLEFGPNPSPIIVQRFSNPQAPGQVNREQLNYFKQLIEQGGVKEAIDQGQLSPTFPDYWLHQEKEIRKERLQSKINALVSKAMYVPTWLAEMGFAEQNHFVDFTYAKVPFDEIDNSEISLTDADYSAYLKENAARFKVEEETRKMDYVVFDVLPTAADSAANREFIAGLIEPFRIAENDSNFVLSREGQIAPVYYSKDQLSPVIADTVMAMSIGEVYGPYFEAGAYKAVKVLDHVTMADSADTRHILLSATAPAEFAKAKKTVDSLANLLETGVATFDSLAIKFSQDPGSASTGGVYEGVTPNQFVPQFNEVLFKTGQVGQLYKVRTDFGWHLIEILKRNSNTTTRVQVAYVMENIVPSKDTQAEAYERASAFAGENRTIDEMIAAAADQPDLSVKTTKALLKNDFSVGEMGAGDDSREIVRWAFTASKDEVSPTVYTYKDNVAYFDSKYVIVGLKSIQKAGIPSIENIKEEIEPAVINKKKGELLKQQMESMDMNAVASQYDVPIDTARNATFSQSFVQNLGNEPKVIANAFGLEQGQVSAPIVGESGVFKVMMIKKPVLAAPTNLPQVRQRMASNVRSQVTSNLIQAMKDKAGIEDYRSKFY